MLNKITVLLVNGDCTIPEILRGAWFSWENGRNTLTELDATTMTRKGYCINSHNESLVNHTLIFKNDKCYTCVKLIVRTVNVIEKIECEYTEKAISYLSN